MKTAFITIESLSIWCPECNDFVSVEDGGSSRLTETEYDSLPKIIDCKKCQAKFRKPQVKFTRGSTVW
jgi:hypothetical protein